MGNKNTNVISTVLCGVAILLLLAAAFDVLPMPDNLAIFLALACFVILGMIKKISKGCC